MAGDIFDDDDLTRAKIARPTPTGTPLTLRGVPSPGSTANLEDSAAKIPTQMGASLRTATQPEAPSPLEKQTSIDRAQQTNLDKGSGISQIANPWARNTLRGVNVLGSVAGAIIPQIHSVMGAIPGTEEHHQRLVGQNNAALGLDVGQAEKQAQTAHEQAQTQSLPAEADYHEAQAENLRNPQPKPKEEDWTAIPGVTGANGELIQQEKNSGQVRPVGADKLPGGVQPLKPPTDKQDSPEQQFINEETSHGVPLQKAVHDYAVASAHPQQSEGGSYMPLYDEKGHVTGAWNPKTGKLQSAPADLPGNTAQGHTIGEKQTAAATKEAQPYQQMIDIATQAHELADMAQKGNASADVDLVLSFFKMMRGTGGANIRFTQQEQNLILGARNTGQDLMAIGQKVVGSGQPLTPEQRSHMVSVIDMHAKAAQQHLATMQHGQPQGGGQQPQGGGADPLGIR